VRFFRIPSFTGIEAHRDDADRGSLRLVEGCLPHGPGGLRSGPVWNKIGDVQYVADGDQNKISSADDGLGNSIVFVSRQNEVHDIALLTTEHTELESFTEQEEFTFEDPSLYTAGPANITPIGNKLYAVGDGSNESIFVGKGPDDTFEVFPDESLYSQEWSRFPKCQFFVQGPKKTIFAAGNPDKPLTVYISEPAGLTSPYRDTPYSTEDTTYNRGVLSTVDILGSNASKITALSTRGDQVVVHTDKGCHLLYAPAPDQANTGYRVEQAPATNFSAAVNSKVVSRASGSLTYWVGHDGQVYKDEAASRGSEDLRSRADEDQANWKSKGVWEDELPTDLTKSFAVYSPQTGMYWFFVESEEKKTFDLIPRTPLRGPRNLIARILAPFFGPTNLEAVILPPEVGPTNLEAEVLPPEVGPTNLEAIILPPEVGPTNLETEVLLPESGPTNLDAEVLPPTEGPTNLEAEVLLPESGPTNLDAEVLPPEVGPTNLKAIILPPPEVGPTNLEAVILPPEVGPTNLKAIILPPEVGPTNLKAIILPPEVGPTNLDAEVLPPEVGPTNLEAVILPPEVGPTNLEAVILPPTEGPTNLDAEVLPPEVGPTNLDAEVLPPEVGPTNLEAVILPPTEGPTNLDAVILPPTEGPTNLEAIILPPEVGPTNLDALVLPPQVGPTNLQAVELLGPFSAKVENVVGGWNLTGYSSVKNTGNWTSFLNSYNLNSNTGTPVTLSVRAEVDSQFVDAHFHKIYIPEEVIFNPDIDDPYWDSVNRWYYKSEVDGLTYNQDATVQIIWGASPVAPYLGPTNLQASIPDDFTPDPESLYIVVEISEEGTNLDDFNGWQSDELGYSDPGGLLTVEETRYFGTTSEKSGVKHNVGAQRIEIGGRNGHVNSVYHPGILVRNDNGYFMNGSAYTMSAVANEGWSFTGWVIKHLNTTPESERLGTAAGEVQIVSGALDNPTDLTLLVTDHTNYITVKAEFIDRAPDADEVPDPGNKYNLENCECVSDSGSGLGDFDTLQECEDWKAAATFNCIGGECVEDDMQMGTYSSCADCQAACGSGGSDPCDDTAGIYDYSPDNNTCWESMEPSSMQYTECDCVNLGATIV